MQKKYKPPLKEEKTMAMYKKRKKVKKVETGKKSHAFSAVSAGKKLLSRKKRIKAALR